MFLISRIINTVLRNRILNSFGLHLYKWGYRKGFTSQTLEVCGITKDNYKDFLTDRDYTLGHPYNGAYSSIIDNKLWLPMLLHNYKEYIPEYYFFIDEGGLLPLEDYTKTHSAVRLPNSAFFELLVEKHTLCLKHTHSSVGQGFMLVREDNGKFFVNNNEKTKDDLNQILGSLRQYIVTEFVKQHSYASSVCSTSLNTIRFLCVWDEDKKEFFLARSFHRFGCNGNVVDNIGSGNGMLAFVDVNKGILLSEGSVNFNHTGDKYMTKMVHPDQNIKLGGIEIPRFKEVKAKILEIANANSYMRYMGFDVAITEDSFKIIELNSLSSLDVTQQREGFLKDSRIRKVLKK